METSVNNKCKAFTSLEQSRKLAKILPPESADMCYYYKDDKPQLTPYSEHNNRYYIPCWSLAALLGQMICPKMENYVQNIWDLDAATDDTLQRWLSVQDCPTAIDACYEMIIKLHEIELM